MPRTRLKSATIGIDPPSLEVGARADLVVLRRPTLEASEMDVALVVAGGVPRVADPALVPALGELGDAGWLETLNGVVRWIGAQRASSPDRGLPAMIESSRIAR